MGQGRRDRLRADDVIAIVGDRPSADHMSTVAASFRLFAERRCGNYAPLYRELATRTGTAPELLGLVADARPIEHAPNLLFAAAHEILLERPSLPAAAWWPTVATDKVRGGDPFPSFQELCLDHRDRIAERAATRLVQTNEVNRCSYLLPMLSHAADVAGTALTVIELGTSAGLNLLWDRYRYDYGRLSAGDQRSTVTVQAAFVGSAEPAALDRGVVAPSRIGVDLHPVHLDDASALEWLRALVWADHPRRLHRLDSAVSIARQAGPDVRRGDVTSCLAEIVAAVPDDSMPCIVHTALIPELTVAGRRALAHQIVEIGQQRDLIVLAAEEATGMVASWWKKGRLRQAALGDFHIHGAWVRWRAAAGLKFRTSRQPRSSC